MVELNKWLLQEALVSVLGCALFLLVSILTYTSYSHPTYGAPAGKLLSGLCGAVAVMLAINTIVLGLTLRKWAGKYLWTDKNIWSSEDPTKSAINLTPRVKQHNRMWIMRCQPCQLRYSIIQAEGNWNPSSYSQLRPSPTPTQAKVTDELASPSFKWSVSPRSSGVKCQLCSGPEQLNVWYQCSPHLRPPSPPPWQLPPSVIPPS